jgi:hypothetical protein
MAGNVQADNSGNIYVEFDYNNIIVVDPNKTIDALGKIRERLVDHENLVMYANLEAELLPRTKLAIGASPEDRIRIVSIAKMDFLKPTKDSALGTGYYDELTGDNTTRFKGVNQMMTETVVPKDGSKPYVVEKPSDLTNVLDNGLLGITSISVDTNLSFVPTVRISLEDVQGKALFQLGNNSPYAAFFNLPYPPFYLTLKGYYGQAIRYQLNLEKFNARFNTFSGNYQIDLDFKGYKFNILNEIAVGHLIATPHMYSQQYNVSAQPIGPQQTNREQQTSVSTQTKAAQQVNDGRQTQATVQITSERGYQKIKEVYSEYKSKALIPPDFPEYTLVQFINKLDLFEQNVADKFAKADVEPLTNIRNYKGVLTNYFGTSASNGVRAGESSWFTRYLNPAPLILKNGTRTYIFKELDFDTKLAAQKQLQSIVADYNKLLASNPTLGAGGAAPIPNPIKYQTIAISAPPTSEIDWAATTSAQTGIVKPTEQDMIKIQNEFKRFLDQPPVLKSEIVNGKTIIEEIKISFFVFEGDGRFDKQIQLLEAQANKKLSQFEEILTKKLLEKIESGTDGIGFKPTVRNIMAVLMASAEAFIRLLDDVHGNAWNVKYDPVRKKAILNNPSSAPGSDTVDDLKLTQTAIEQSTGLKYAEIPVYPWPQFFIETPEDKKGRFQLKYPADPSVVDLTQGWDYSKWPEVEFVEEYMRGITQKFNPPLKPEPLENELNTNIININAIEFPSQGIAYVNKEEIKFFYEIWERQLLTSRYSNYVRANSNQVDELVKLNTEAEVSNIVSSLGLNAPYITMKLKNYDLNSTNYEDFLKNISNNGTGRAWQDFIRDFYVTPYIKNLTENSFGILNIDEYGKIPLLSTKSSALAKLVSNSTNEPNITDTVPFTDSFWVTQNMANGKGSEGTNVYNTNKVLTVFEPRKVISNFNDIYNFDIKRPVTSFSYKKTTGNNPYTKVKDVNLNQIGLTSFYYDRINNDSLVATEGLYTHIPPSVNTFIPALSPVPIVSTTSMMNTPFMVNAIQNGVQNYRNKVKYPYVQASYLFLNSLPIATLKEKYKSLSNDQTSDLDYIASCLKKFGAVHKLPYAWILKMGSVYHRYKVFKETNVDIINSAWSNFNYVNNFSPISGSTTQTYNVKIGGETKPITLQTETTGNINIQVGFYPKVINDFYAFLTGYEVYKDYTDKEIQNTINGGMKVFNFSESNIQTKQGDKDLRLTTWSVLIPSVVKNGIECNPNDNTQTTAYTVVPSFGSSVNQTAYECLNNPTQVSSTLVNLTNNPSMYNGSVRLFWAAPNYGYFDNQTIIKPSPESYIKQILSGETKQSSFNLMMEDNYSKIEEIFSVFEKSILDSFEQEFLNFSKSMNDIDLPVSQQIGASSVSVNADFKNFQALFKSILTVLPKTSTTNEQEYFTGIINTQYDNLQNTLRAFLEYDVLFKFGNPSNYKRRIWDSYLSHNGAPTITDPIKFKPYVKGTLPSRGGTISLAQSKAQNPAAWFALETEVGFSTIPNLRYSATGSYITDFFIDNDIEFTTDNVVLLSQLIKMYSTFKLKSPSSAVSQFKNQIQYLFNSEDILQGNFLNEVLKGLNKALPSQYQVPQGTVNSVITGEQSKIENWEVFKALNDKWIAGGDYKSKTLFEDIMFLDRASRNIGQTILIDIFDLKSMLGKSSLNNAMSVFTLMSGILIKNNFTVMNLPAYVNFYNVQDVDGTTIPKPEGTLDFANNLWGTFLNVDYRNATSKMVCFYVGKPSQYLDLPKGNFRFRDDGFEMRRASENPLIENQTNKKDWSLSNKCVGFNVDIGIRNQNIFYSFQVDQSAGVATSESINTQLNMVDQASGRNVATQNVSLYNLYKNRSYKCTVVCLGNALLQPSMYFNLRHVPMFNGPYMIQSIQHTIQPGNFQTSFTGIRQGIYDLPSIDSFLQSMNQNLLTKLEEVLKIKKDEPPSIKITEEQKANQTVQKADNTLDAQNSCTSKVDLTAYQGYTVLAGVPNSITPETFKNALLAEYPGQSNELLRTYIYCISYVTSFVKSSNSGAGNFVAYNNNLGLISLDRNFQPRAGEYFSKKQFCCVNVKTGGTTKSMPIVAFASLQEYIKFIASGLSERLPQIQRNGLDKFYVCHFPKDNVSETYYDTNYGEFETVRKTMEEAIKSAVAVKLITEATSDALNATNNAQSKNSKTPGVTPTPTPLNPNAGQVCPPPYINTFAPAVGYTGTQMVINGRNLDTETKVFFKDGNTETAVEQRYITVIDKQTLRIVVPEIGDGKVLKNTNIRVQTSYGSFTTVAQFKYDPSIPASEASSPGSFVNGASGTQNQNISNTNPTIPALVETQRVTSTNQTTDLIKVDVAPNVGVWTIASTQTLTYSYKKISRGPNNSVTKTEKYTGTQSLTGFVSNNGQTFQFTKNAAELLFNGVIPQVDRVNAEINCQIQITAIPADRVKNPQNQTLSFNYNFVYPVQVTNNTTEPGSLVIVQETNSGELPNFAGDDYYNIKKGPGGYITLKFSCTNLVQKGAFKLVSIPDLVDQQITITKDSDTKYTNVIQTNSIGRFQASVDYKSNDLTVTLPNSSSPTLVNTAATSPIITLS